MTTQSLETSGYQSQSILTLDEPTLWVYGSVLICLVIFSVYKKEYSFLVIYFSLTALVWIIAFVYYLLCGDSSSKEAWSKWSDEHCTIIEKKQGTWGYGLGATFDGEKPDQTHYQCDDGKNYWKND